MSTDEEKRDYVLRALAALGSSAPKRYVEMLTGTPKNRGIESLYPWGWDNDPESFEGFCSKALGRLILPFANAAGEDMIACFETQPSQNPAVVVINPWGQDEGEWVKSDVEIARLPDYEAWLVYAKKISDNVREREREEAEDGGES